MLSFTPTSVQCIQHKPCKSCLCAVKNILLSLARKEEADRTKVERVRDLYGERREGECGRKGRKKIC